MHAAEPPENRPRFLPVSSQGGDLFKALHSPNGKLPSLRWRDHGQHIALDIVRGLAFLHKHTVSALACCLCLLPWHFTGFRVWDLELGFTILRAAAVFLTVVGKHIVRLCPGTLLNPKP